MRTEELTIKVGGKAAREITLELALPESLAEANLLWSPGVAHLLQQAWADQVSAFVKVLLKNQDWADADITAAVAAYKPVDRNQRVRDPLKEAKALIAKMSDADIAAVRTTFKEEIK